MRERGYSLTRSLISGLERQADRPIVTLVPSHSTGVEQELTGATLMDGTYRFSALVQDRGVKPGDLVLLTLDHSADLLFAFLGCLHAGAIPSILPSFQGAANREGWREQLESLVGAAKPAAILVDTPHRAVLESPPGPRCLLIDAGDAPADADPEWRAGEGGQATYVQFSSGTTGPATGIVLSHDNLRANLEAFAQAIRFGDGTCAVGWLPLYHDMGLVSQLLLPVTRGGRAVLLPPSYWVRQPLSLVHAITRHRGETCWMPNFGFRHCAVAASGRDLDGVDLTSLRFLGNGSERIDPGAFEAFAAAFEGRGLDPACFHVGYGLAEFVLAVTVGPYPGAAGVDRIRPAAALSGRATPSEADESDSMAVVGCGTPVAGAELQIRDEDGFTLPDRGIGRVFVRGESTAIGFWRRDESYSDRVADGWLDTRDRGYLVGDELYLIDRADDMIIVGGQNLLPVYIEEIALSIAGPLGGRAAAFGVFDGSRGTQGVVLILEVRGRLDAAPAEAMDRRIRYEVAARLGIGIADLRIVRRGWIEKTTSGKVSRTRAKARYVAEFVLVEAGLPDPEVPGARAEFRSLEDRLLARTARALGLPGLELDEDVFEAGADSIRVAAWLTKLQETDGLAVGGETFDWPLSVRRLAERLGGATGAGTRRGWPPATEPAAVPATEPVVVPAPVPDPGTGQASHPGPDPAAFDRHRSESQRLIRALARLVGKRLPTRAGSAVMKSLARWIPVSWVLSSAERGAFAAACKVVLCDDPPPGFQRQVAASVLSRYWISAVLPHVDRSDPVVRVEGLEHVRQALNARSGLIIASTHGGEDGALRPVLAYVVGTDPFLVGLGRADREDGSREADTVRRMTAQLLEAERLLTTGGVVALAADGRRGRSFQEVAFLGRTRLLGTGFAELAVRTGAMVVPMSSRITPDGLLIRFAPCLPVAASGPDAVRSLVAGYAGFLEHRWKTDLASVYPPHVTAFFGTGSADPDPAR